MLSSNFKRLVAHIASIKAVPSGGDFADGLRFFLDKEKFTAVMQESQNEANAYIDAVISSPDNSYGNDREKIAGEILRRIQALKTKEV